jgi:predicted transcriptional regulator
MARRAARSPTHAELEILKVLWSTGPSTLGEVWNAVRANRRVARTTIATTLGTMLGKGLVTRERGPQVYLWSAAVNEESTAERAAKQLLDQVFDGSAHRLMVHLIQGGELNERDLDAIRRLVDEYRRSGALGGES